MRPGACGFWGIRTRPGREATRRCYLAKSLSHPYQSGACLVLGAAMLHQLRREGRVAQEQAEALMALASEHGFPIVRGTGDYPAGLEH